MQSPVRFLLSPDSVAGATIYTMTNLLKTPKTYLQAFYKADAGFILSALSGLNLFNHHAHKGAMFIDDGSTI